jgi:hypothetical protein
MSKNKVSEFSFLYKWILEAVRGTLMILNQFPPCPWVSHWGYQIFMKTGGDILKLDTGDKTVVQISVCLHHEMNAFEKIIL